MIKKYLFRLTLLLLLSASMSAKGGSFDAENSGIGQTIQITTRLHSFVGKPSWLLIIRDIDRGKVYPYLYDINRGNNFWLAFTYSRNYLITVSKLQFNTYRSRYNTYKNYVIKDFCNLESNGQIIRNRSLYITIEGDLSRNPNNYRCHITSFKDTEFTVVTPQ